MKTQIKNRTQKDACLAIAEVNKRLTHAVFISWLIAVATYFLCLTLPNFALLLAKESAEYVPSIAMLFARSSPIGSMSAIYFGAVVWCWPLMIILMIWRQDPCLRFEAGRQRMKLEGRGSIELFVIRHLICLPFVIFVLFIFYAAPFAISQHSKLFGAVLQRLMLDTEIGLLLLGSLLVTALALFGAGLMFYCLRPLFFVVRLFKDNNDV